MWGTVSQGDANRSYSDEDQSSSNMEEFDKFQEGLESSGGKQISIHHLGGQDFSPEVQAGRRYSIWFPLKPRLRDC